jgi:hypothetical protein
MEDVGRVFESKLVALLIVGIVLLVISRLIKRGRVEGEDAGVVENLMMAIGILMTVSGIIFAISRGCNVDVPEKEKEKLQEFSDEPQGCGRPKDEIPDFKR